MPLDFPHIAGAVLLATLAMLSLLVGVGVGLFAKPSQRTNAIVMAFGTGALIQALALELAFEGAERLMTEDRLSGLASWLWVAAGFVLGGVLYYLGDRRLERYGAALRHRALTNSICCGRSGSSRWSCWPAWRRWNCCASLPPEEMEDVLLCVQPVHFAAGDTIFRQGEAGDAYIDRRRPVVFANTNPTTRTALLARLPKANRSAKWPC